MKMSISRVALVLVQAFSNQLACTPPNPTPQKGRYHTDEIYILQIAPFIFKVGFLNHPSYPDTHHQMFFFCTPLSSVTR